ncbi:MAG TPA: peroxiredoxin family protein [Candidatus Binatia bacterium]|jgi:peroxiredoxin|nr:peroxiredoxin family protein [Candidatus Binatia bacterium]
MATTLTLGSMLGFAAAALVLVVGARWLQLMQQVRIPEDTRGFVVACGLSALLGIAALVLGAGVGGGIAAVVAVVGGGAFVALSAASGQPARTPAVTVGGPVVPFTATDADGRPFDTASLRGRPFLLKFFRGHWCPYCTAELRRWEELRLELDARGIAIVTVCADTAEQIRAGRGKHGLRATMVPDPALAITDRYNLRSPKNFAPKPGVIIPLPIPTTILVDATGTVRWIDQATDYMRRSDPDRVLTAIRRTLDDEPQLSTATRASRARR